MDLKLMSPETEERVLRAIKESIRLANSGMSPDDAIAKTASENKFCPEIVKRMVEAFNSSKTLFLFKQADFDRTSEFELADARNVIAKMYPLDAELRKDAKYQGIPRGYGLPESEDFTKQRPEMTKAASSAPKTRLPDIEFIVKRAYDQHLSDLRGIDVAKTAAALARERFREKMVKISRYWIDKPATERRSFEEVEQDVVSIWGEKGKKAMDILWELGKGRMQGERRSQGEPKYQRIADLRQEPIPEIRMALDLAVRCAKESQVVEKMTEEATKFWDACKERFRALRKDGADFFSQMGEKAVGALSSGYSEDRLPEERTPLWPVGGTRRILPPPPRAEEPMSEIPAQELLSVLEPEHEVARRNIEAASMLASMLANDPVISQSDERTVLSAYNKVAKLAPRASREPVIVQFLLRKMLQQGDTLDLYDIHTLIQVENRLKQRDQLTPETLLT